MVVGATCIQARILGEELTYIRYEDVDRHGYDGEERGGKQVAAH
jgi:hypothetical protein